MNIVYKEFITGRDVQELEKCLLENIKIGSDGKPKEFDTAAVTKRLNRAIELCVVSVEGKTEGILDLILALPAQKYFDVVKKVKEISGIENDEKKTDSPTNTD